MSENPKMAGSGIVSLRVQTEPCPGGGTPSNPWPCAFCYYNARDAEGKCLYYEDISEPHIPMDAELAEHPLVRVNDGHDANHSRSLVIAATQECIRKGARGAYMNTSIPRFDFPDGKGGQFPVIFTANGRYPIFVEKCPPNLMAVRIRFNSWEYGSAVTLALHYYHQDVPVILTPMRYPVADAMPPEDREIHYTHKKHILNEYWCMRDEALELLSSAMRGSLHGWDWLLVCNKLCAQCGNCKNLWERKQKGK